jgi:quinol monooxygenase YgiN
MCCCPSLLYTRCCSLPSAHSLRLQAHQRIAKLEKENGCLSYQVVHLVRNLERVQQASKQSPT